MSWVREKIRAEKWETAQTILLRCPKEEEKKWGCTQRRTYKKEDGGGYIRERERESLIFGSQTDFYKTNLNNVTPLITEFSGSPAIP